MKAIVQRTYGTPDVLTLTEREAPRVGDRDVLVEVRASGVTQGDRRLRTGDFPGFMWLPGRLMMGLTGPRKPVPGTVFAGRVVATGSKVTRWAVGDDVFGSLLHGAWSEAVVVREDGPIAKMPRGIGYGEAAALPYGGVTALVFLRDIAKIRPGEHVCILGASGGVGRLAVQLAKHLGAEVTAVCGKGNHDLVRGLGADHVVDYRSEDFRAGGPRFDVVVDLIGETRLDQCRSALTPRGRYLGLIISLRRVLQTLRTSIAGRRRSHIGVAMPRQEHLETLAALAESGAIRPVLDRTFPLARIADAHAHLESGSARGSIVIDVAQA